MRQMDFTMRSWKKYNSSIYKVIAFISCFFIPVSLFAQGIKIQRASSELVEDVYLLEARINFAFDKEVINALEHGVALHIDVIVRLKKMRNWWWDATVKQDILRFKLEFQPLSNHYLVTNTATGDRQQLQSLEQALLILGTINKHTFFHKNLLDKQASYLGLIRARLNIESLPPPLRPVAYVSKQWQLKSPWYKWSIR